MYASLSRSAGIPLKYANRHGLITGQTGTGKTVSLMRLAESFSAQGVPVFLSDVKSDLAALSRSCPAVALDVFGMHGKPLKVMVDAMGADLMARALELTDTQAGCLEIAFAAARDHGFAMATLDDLRRVLQSLGFQIDTARYGKVSAASVSVIMRALEEDGLLVPPGDTDALARAIIRLMEQPELRSRLGEAARNKAARYAMDPVCAAWMDLFRQLNSSSSR